MTSKWHIAHTPYITLGEVYHSNIKFTATHKDKSVDTNTDYSIIEFITFSMAGYYPVYLVTGGISILTMAGSRAPN